MQTIPPEWLREKTTVEEIGLDWSARRKKHNWWCPSPPEWNREWESFHETLKAGGDLFHFSSHPNGWPEGATDEGYVIIRDGVQVRVICWVGEHSDYSLKT